MVEVACVEQERRAVVVNLYESKPNLLVGSRVLVVEDLNVWWCQVKGLFGKDKAREQNRTVCCVQSSSGHYAARRIAIKRNRSCC